MSHLEVKNKSVIGALMADLSFALDESQQRLLSAWVLKTSMMFESTTHSVRDLYYTQDERDALRLAQAIPSRTEVWIGRYLGDYPTYAEGHDGWDREFVVHSYVTTLSAMFFAMQVLSFRPTVNSNVPIEVNPKGGPWKRSLIQIWPTRGVVMWPPKLTFGDEGDSLPISRLMNRWRGVPLPQEFAVPRATDKKSPT